MCSLLSVIVHGYVETATVVAVLNEVDQTSDDIVGLPLYRTQFKVDTESAPGHVSGADSGVAKFPVHRSAPFTGLPLTAPPRSSRCLARSAPFSAPLTCSGQLARIGYNNVSAHISKTLLCCALYSLEMHGLAKKSSYPVLMSLINFLVVLNR